MQGIAAHPTSPARHATRAGRVIATSTVALAAACLLAVTASPTQAATIYKSVDERGNVQFSQTPPKDRPSEELEAGGSVDKSSSDAPAVEAEDDAAAEEVDNASDPAKEVKVVDREKARETCRQAREQREAVAESGNQLMVQDEAGKYRPMGEEQRAERLERLDAIIEEACSAAEE